MKDKQILDLSGYSSHVISHRAINTYLWSIRLFIPFSPLTLSLLPPPNESNSLHSPPTKSNRPTRPNLPPLPPEISQLTALRTTPPTPTLKARTGRRIGVVAETALPTRPNSHRNTLDDAAVVVANGVHAVVDGEVATDEIRAHRGVLTCQRLGLTHCVRLVLAVVDAHDAGESCSVGVGFVEGFGPAAPAAEACFWEGYFWIWTWGDCI